MNSDAMMIVLVHLSIVFLGTPGLGRRRLHLAIKIGKTKSGYSGINYLKILRYPRAKSYAYLSSVLHRLAIIEDIRT